MMQLNHLCRMSDGNRIIKNTLKVQKISEGKWGHVQKMKSEQKE